MKPRYLIPLFLLFALRLAAGPESMLTEATKAIDQSKLPPEQRYDVPVTAKKAVYPVYPFELLNQGVGGMAAVGIVVDARGRLEDEAVISATDPAFGEAVMAMASQWKFAPAMRDGKPVMTQAILKAIFLPKKPDKHVDDTLFVPISDSADDLLYELQKKHPDFCSAKNLDAKPHPVSMRKPVFPHVLVGVVSEGEAVVKFVVDRKGKVQLPRVISATRPEFGYAAAQAAALWTFTPPTSQGKPVDIQVTIPLSFKLKGPKVEAKEPDDE